MPGQILLALPFYIIGDGGLQNIFWLSAIVVLIFHKMDYKSAASIVVFGLLFGSPIIIYQAIQGGDYLSNSIYLMLAVVIFYDSISRNNICRLNAILASVFLGVALASRFNYVLVLPVISFNLIMEVSIWRVICYFISVEAAFVSLVLPFFLYDPSGFSPLHTSSKNTASGEYPLAPPLPVVLVLVLSICRVIQSKRGNLNLLLQHIFIVQLTAITSGFIASSLAIGHLDFFDLHYMTLITPFGLLPYGACFADSYRNKLKAEEQLLAIRDEVHPSFNCSSGWAFSMTINYYYSRELRG